MPAKNLYHDAVVAALTADGWTITDDPLTLAVGRYRLHADIAADRNGDGIVVDVLDPEFGCREDRLHAVIGRYTMWRAVAEHYHPGWMVFWAITPAALARTLDDPLARIAFAASAARLIEFDPSERRIVRWVY